MSMVEMLFNGVASRRTARRNPELAVDRSQVPVDRERADDEVLSYLDIGLALCDQAQYLHLARSQADRIG